MVERFLTNQFSFLAALVGALALASCGLASRPTSGVNSIGSGPDRQSKVFGIAEGKNILMAVNLTDLTSDTKLYGKFAKIYNDLPDELSPDEQMKKYGRHDQMKDCEFQTSESEWTLAPSDPCFDSLQAYYSATQAGRAYEALRLPSATGHYYDQLQITPWREFRRPGAPSIRKW